MKLAIVSDTHLGYERFYDDAYAQAREALEAASKLADAIIIPGDVFDKRNPKPEVIAQGINLFRDISRLDWHAKVTGFTPYGGPERQAYTDVPIVAIPGTHERVAEGKDNPLELLALAGLLVDGSEAMVTIEKGAERLSVFSLGGLSEERVGEEIRRMAPKPVQGSFNVFMFHQSIYELLPFDDSFMRYADLPPGFNLYVDGHIHNKVIGNVHGADFLIPGSTVLTQLKDGEQEPKGFFIYDTSERSFEFHEIKSRRFVVPRVSLNDATPQSFAESAESALASALGDAQDGPVIRLRIEGTIAKGYRGLDMPIRQVLSKFLGKAIIEVDTSRLEDSESKKEIEELREGKLEGVSIKELGMSLFAERLRENGFSGEINVAELFDILSSEKKEKALKAARQLLEPE